MITTQDRQVFLDISTIIKMMPKSMSEKIDKEFVDMIENNKDENYISTINPNIPLREQYISEDAKNVLAIIYRDYLCTDVDRKELIKKEDEIIQKIESLKIDGNTVFKKENTIEKQSFHEEKGMIKKTEKWYDKIVDRIKQWLYRK